MIIGNKYGFVIDSNTGIVKVNDSSFLDREVTSELMLTIQARDDAPPDLTKSAIVLVNTSFQYNFFFYYLRYFFLITVFLVLIIFVLYYETLKIKIFNTLNINNIKHPFCLFYFSYLLN